MVRIESFDLLVDSCEHKLGVALAMASIDENDFHGFLY